MENLAASIVIGNKNNVWVDDNMVTKCHACQTEFSMFRRKHHCRNCGNIFCYNCSDHHIEIPDFVKDRPERADIWNPSYHLSFLGGARERVCRKCYDVISRYKTIHDNIDNYYQKPIEYINNLPVTEKDIVDHYCQTLRNIQYYLPNHEYSHHDKIMLRSNAHHFSGHSKYIIHLIKSLDWSTSAILPDIYKTYESSNSLNIPSSRSLATFDLANYNFSCIDVDRVNKRIHDNLALVLKVLQHGKTTDCFNLLCTRTCNETLTFDDCVHILYSTANVLPDELLEYLFNIMMHTPDEIILCHLSFFIGLIRDNNGNDMLRKLLFVLLNRTEKIRYHTFWFLTNAKEDANLIEISNINLFIQSFDAMQHRKMHNEYMFFSGLIDNLNDAKTYLAREFYLRQPISLPYEPSFELIDVNLDNIIVKKSHTKPVEIMFRVRHIDNGSEGWIRLLFKKESIMNDVTVLNLMILSNIILRDSLDTNFDVIVYSTMPLTSNSGMIEIINDATTIYDICKQKKILYHILSKNEDKLIGDVLDRYMYSLVLYTLQSYFIGLGDRHLQNIMLTDDGAIFHIDFGFIMGNDAHSLTGGEIKLNSDILDVIGGKRDERYIKYIDLCSRGVILLRKYYRMFFILFAQDKKNGEKSIEKFIMSRFQPRQNDIVVIQELLTVVANSNNAYSDYIRDFLHHLTHERTIQNNLYRAINSVYDTVRSFS